MSNKIEEKPLLKAKILTAFLKVADENEMLIFNPNQLISFVVALALTARVLMPHLDSIRSLKHFSILTY